MIKRKAWFLEPSSSTYLLHFGIRETKTQQLPWSKELLCHGASSVRRSKKGTCKTAKSWTLTYKDRGENWQDTERNVALYFDGNSMWFHVPWLWKKNQEPPRECFWSTLIFLSAWALCKRSRQQVHFPLHQLCLPLWERETHTSLQLKYSLTSKAHSGSAMESTFML